ncbi:MAG: DUF294 nucleotidyltransferase-like domain-containing protein [Limnohabitans sp.]
MSVELYKPWGEDWLQEMLASEPFARMETAHVLALAMSGQAGHAAAGTTILDPGTGVPPSLYWIWQGGVAGYPDGMEASPFELEVGSLWPVGALLAERAVRTRYVAREKCAYVRFPWTQVRKIMALSPALANHLTQLGLTLLEASRGLLLEQLKDCHQQTVRFEQPLSAVPDKPVRTLPDTATLLQVLQAMHQPPAGAVLLTDTDGGLSGILTRDDVIGRVVLPRLSLDEPVSKVMSQPVEALDSTRSLEEATVLMISRQIGHLPILREGRVVNLVSEHDLFTLQSQGLRHLRALINQAYTVPELRNAATAIRALAAQLIAQGISPESLTRLHSQLNDQLTVRIIDVVHERSVLPRQKFCWVALGSEGRREQTIATDQDNALIFMSEQPTLDRARWQALARQINDTLDACGYPLCRGGIMASTADWCRTPEEWSSLAAEWIERGAPHDLLNAAIWFDMRVLHGPLEWTEALRQDYVARLQVNPRFFRQWVEQHLHAGVAINWLGGLATETVDGCETIDIKHAGTAIVVDAARIMAMRCGLACTSTVDRLQQAGRQLGIPASEYQGWVTAFSYLQALRLRQQMRSEGSATDANRIATASFNQVDRQFIKQALNAIRTLQTRLRLDFI